MVAILDRNGPGYFFYLQHALIFPNIFGVNWPFGSGEEAQNIVSRWWPEQPHRGFPIETILAILDLQVIPMLPTKFRVN